MTWIIGAAACGSQGARVEKGTSPEPAGAARQQDKPRPPSKASTCRLAGPHAVSRALFEKYLRGGPAHLLALVTVRRYPKRGEGPFRGWRVSEVRDPCLALALQSGDVILALDGRVVERPDDFYQVWRSLKGASRLTILRLRNGRIQRLELDVVD